MVKYKIATPNTASTSNVTSSQKATSFNINGRSKSLAMSIIRHKLSENNNLQRSHSIMLFICGKSGKDDFLIRATIALLIEDPKYKAWKSENNMVVSCLINYMPKEIGEDFMHYKSAKEIWDAIKETYSNNDSTSALFEVKSILNDLRQGELTITQ